MALSIDGIELLHRSADGWESLGQVAPDAPDLVDALAEMRARALERAPDGLATQVLIPNSQIRYLTLDTGVLDDAGRKQAARDALQGATPYAVEDLAFDIGADDELTHVAAVARETLEEAEIFATEHGFNPVGYVAIPGPRDGFPGRAVFDAARDPHPPATFSSRRAGMTQADAEDTDGAADVQFVSRRAGAHRPESTDAAPAERHATDPQAPPADTAAPAMPDLVEPATRAEAEPDMPDPVAHVAHGDEDTPPPAAAEITEIAETWSEPVPDAESEPEPEPESAPTPPPAPVADAGPVLAPPLPAPPREPPADETVRMTVFGARPGQQVGGKPRYLGLALTVLLLILLAAAAAWARLDTSAPLAWLFRSAPDETELAVEPEPPADSPATLSDDQFAALPAPEVIDPVRVGVTPEVPEQPAPEPELAADDPRLAQMGIHIQPPAAPPRPAGPGEDVYEVSIDPTGLSQDAVALAPQAAQNPDVPPEVIGGPAIPGLVVAFDERGLVTPSRGGTMNPDGVLVHLGKPPVVPPLPTRRGPDPAEDPAAATRTEEEIRRDRLAQFRPKPRPENLGELNERGRLGGHTINELSRLRPRARPQTVKQVAEQDETPTAQAVVVSLRPDPRPRNFEALARRVSPAPKQQQGQQVAAASAASTAAVTGGRDGSNVATFAPRTVKPRAPSPASVARRATLNNALNMQRVNLIGVYGTPSRRRALIRLPSGRYSKVKVGDRVDGGKVVAIGDSEVRYQKRGRTVTLKMPRG